MLGLWREPSYVHCNANYIQIAQGTRWLLLSDSVDTLVHQSQHYELLRYVPLVPIAFHLLFAGTTCQKLVYPHSHYQVSTTDLQL